MGSEMCIRDSSSNFPNRLVQQREINSRKKAFPCFCLCKSRPAASAASLGYIRFQAVIMLAASAASLRGGRASGQLDHGIVFVFFRECSSLIKQVPDGFICMPVSGVTFRLPRSFGTDQEIHGVQTSPEKLAASRKPEILPMFDLVGR